MVLGTPTTKCPHGVFKAGQATAEYCSFCNPRSAFSTPSHPVTIEMAETEVEDTEFEMLDCAEFMDRPAGERLAALGR